ncbi:unnamed protein product [Closterium sp. Yama58-4]|nr:unnamed protein product [Closterium sp. Yama58-4]
MGLKHQSTVPTVRPPKDLFLALLAFRLLNSLAVQTYFNPDEFWQGPEVAHRMVFGYGYLTWEWQPEWAARSFLHPLLFAAGYHLLALLRCDTPWLVRHSPRFIQAAMAALADLRSHGSTGGSASLYAHSKALPLAPLRCCIGGELRAKRCVIIAPLLVQGAIAALADLRHYTLPHSRFVLVDLDSLAAAGGGGAEGSEGPMGMEWVRPLLLEVLPIGIFCRTVLPPCHHSTVLPPCHHSTVLPPCHHSTVLPPCHHSTVLPPCHHSTVLPPCHHSTVLPPCHHSTVLPPCHHSTVLPPCHHSTVLPPCHHSTVLPPCHHSTVLPPCHHSTVLPPCHHSTVLPPCHHSTVLPPCHHSTVLPPFPVSGASLTAVAITVAVDSWQYGRPMVFTPLNLLHFNVHLKGSSLYGSNPWHWYWSQGLIAMHGTFFPLACLGLLWCSFPSYTPPRYKHTSWFQHGHHLLERLQQGLVWWSVRLPFVLALWLPLFYSLSDHKEHRQLTARPLAASLLLPLRPQGAPVSPSVSGSVRGSTATLTMLSCAPILTSHPNGTITVSRESEFDDLLANPHAFLASRYTVPPSARTCIVGLIQGAIAAADAHSATADSHPACDATADSPAASPTTCRSSSRTASHGQQEGRCQAAAGARDGGREAQDTAAPAVSQPGKNEGGMSMEEMKKEGFLKGCDGLDGGGRPELPELVVTFDTEEPLLLRLLQCAGYTEVARFLHAHFPVDRELEGHILVYRKHMVVPYST